jgi:hypothetical protein
MRINIAALAFTLLLVSAHDGVLAQSIVGRVVDAESAAPLAGAEVLLVDDADRPRVRGFTDSAGYFEIETGGPGTFRLRISHLGHMAYTSDGMEVSRGEIVRVEVRMGVEAIPLEPLTVVAPRSHQAEHLRDFERRRTEPSGLSGYFLTRDQIERRPATTATKLLMELPAVRIAPIITADNPFGMDRSLIMLQGRGGSCVANVFIDGIRARQTPDHSLDDVLDPSLVAGVELYPRSLLAPIQYQVDPGCGVVLYWTTRPAEEGSRSTGRIIAGAALLGGLIVGGFVIG